MSMQELTKLKRHVDDMRLKHAQAIAREQNLETEFVREIDALKKEYDWAKSLTYANPVTLTIDTPEDEYKVWEQTFQTALEKTASLLSGIEEKSRTQKEEALEKMKEVLRKEGYDV